MNANRITNLKSIAASLPKCWRKDKMKTVDHFAKLKKAFNGGGDDAVTKYCEEVYAQQKEQIRQPIRKATVI